MEILLFGAGSACKNFIKKTKNKKFKILGVLDNDSRKWGSMILGFNIVEPKKVLMDDEYTDTNIIVVSEYYEDIRKQLINEFNVNEKLIKIAPKSLISNTKSYRPFENKIVYGCAKNILKDLITLFNKYNLKYFVDHGTLLGLVRHGDIMTWDDDIDFSILEEDYIKGKNIFEKYFKDIFKNTKNIEVEILDKKDNHIEKAVKALVKIILNNELYVVTIDLAYIKIVDEVAYERFTKAKKDYFLNSEEIYYEGVKVRIPYKYEEYLKYHYGEDWRIVKKDISWSEIKNLI